MVSFLSSIRTLAHLFTVAEHSYLSISIKVGTLAGAVLPDAGEPEELSSPQATIEAIAIAAMGKRTFLEIIVTPYL
jgi:hypothetical protein